MQNLKAYFKLDTKPNGMYASKRKQNARAKHTLTRESLW